MDNIYVHKRRSNEKTLMLRIGEWSFKKRWRMVIVFLLLFLMVCIVCDYHRWVFSMLNWQISVPLIILGQLIRIWSVGVRDSNVRLKILVTTGPYAYVRNPSYLGSFLVGLGIVVMSGLFWFIPIYFALFFVGYQPMVLWEEDNVGRKHGDAYAAYKARVPRWIPSIRPYPHRSAHVFLFLKALKRECNMILVILGLSLLMSVLAWLR